MATLQVYNKSPPIWNSKYQLSHISWFNCQSFWWTK